MGCLYNGADRLGAARPPADDRGRGRPEHSALAELLALPRIFEEGAMNKLAIISANILASFFSNTEKSSFFFKATKNSFCLKWFFKWDSCDTKEVFENA